MRIRWWLLAALSTACAYDFDGFDPRLGGPGGASSAGGRSSGGSGGSAGDGGTSGSGGAPTVAPYAYARRIRFEPTVSLPADYSIRISFDHQSLVEAGTALPSGDDVRIFAEDGDSYLELDRVLDPASSWQTASTHLWFSIGREIAAGETTDSYYLVYGDPGAGAPPADPQQVFLIFDDFEASLSDEWATVAGQNGSVKVDESGALELAGTASSSCDSGVAAIRQVSGPTRVDLHVASWSEVTEGSDSIAASVAVFGTADDVSTYGLFGIGVADQLCSASYVAGMGCAPTCGSSMDAATYLGLAYDGMAVTTYVSSNGIDFTAQASEDATLLPSTYGVGAMTRYDSTSTTNAPVATFDWIRVRRAVSSIPEVTLEPEETAPFR